MAVATMTIPNARINKRTRAIRRIDAVRSALDARHWGAHGLLQCMSPLVADCVAKVFLHW
jgi:hypothetical protein